MRHIKNQRGFGLIELLGVLVTLSIIVIVLYPSLMNTDEPVSQSVVTTAEKAVTPLDASLIEAAAELAYAADGGVQDRYTLGELVDAGYLNVELTDDERHESIEHIGSGAFRYVTD